MYVTSSEDNILLCNACLPEEQKSAYFEDPSFVVYTTMEEYRGLRRALCWKHYVVAWKRRYPHEAVPHPNVPIASLQLEIDQDPDVISSVVARAWEDK